MELNHKTWLISWARHLIIWWGCQNTFTYPYKLQSLLHPIVQVSSRYDCTELLIRAPHVKPAVTATIVV